MRFPFNIVPDGESQPLSEPRVNGESEKLNRIESESRLRCARCVAGVSGERRAEASASDVASTTAAAAAVAHREEKDVSLA